MNQIEKLIAENAALRERLSKLSEIGIRINESLDFDTVVQRALDSVRSLTGARYGVMTLLDDAGRAQDFLSSGMSGEEAEWLWQTPGGEEIFERLGSISEPLRIPDLVGYVRSLGFAEFRLPLPTEPAYPFLATQMFLGNERLGNIFLTGHEGGLEFSREDEQTLVMFASQAALVIANARRHREERRARADLETLIDTSPVGVVVFDASTGNIVSINREAARIAKNLWSPPLPRNQSVEEVLKTVTIVRADGRKFSIDEVPMSDLLKNAETVRVEEVVLKVPHGRSVTTLINATPIFDTEGTVESCVVTLQDLTPIQNLERLRAEFLGIVSHELRAPLTAVKGSATTLIQAFDDLETAEMLQFFKIIDEQTDRMRDLIGELLQVARIEAGTLSVRPEPLEPADLIDEAKKRFLSAGGRDNIAIELDQYLPRIMADRRRIVQVLNNLLNNAEKFSPEPTPIHINIGRKEQYVQIAVTDHGQGISTDALPNLFAKLARHATSENGDQIGRTGLGLPICKGIVEAHGGRIWADSQGPGTGAKFSFTLPAFQEATTNGSVQQDVVSSDNAQGAGKRDLGRILVVDDDPLVLRQVRNTLNKAGYAPLVTGDPEEVKKLIIENQPDLILLDLLLPGTDGIELMERISDTVNVPVIFLSAYRQDEVVTKAFELGAADYIVKPFSESELVARIGAALQKRTTYQMPVMPEPYYRKGLSINFAGHEVTIDGRPVDLTATEAKLLFELAANAGTVLEYEDLLQRLWGPKRKQGRGLVRTVVKRLRQKIGEDARKPEHIFTASGVGYRMMKADTNGD